MIKQLFSRQKSAKSIAASYVSYSEYANNASDEEKKVVIENALKKANELQKELVSTN